MRLRPAILFALGSLAVLAACREKEISHYRVPKEEAPTPPPGLAADAGMAATAVPTAQGAGLTWSAPQDWAPKALDAMRRGSFTVKGADGAEADLSITAFPGDVGGELANVNRWRGQVKLPSIAAADLPAATTKLSAHGLEFTVVDLTSPDAAAPTRILGALVSHDGNTWFFKLMGPSALVAQQKPAFLAFLQTVQAP
ncbi:MAG: hypothetical protein ACHQ4G_10235 [Opitutales bacterium]